MLAEARPCGSPPKRSPIIVSLEQFTGRCGAVKNKVFFFLLVSLSLCVSLFVCVFSARLFFSFFLLEGSASAQPFFFFLTTIF